MMSSCEPFELDGSRLVSTEEGGYQLVGMRRLTNGVSYDLLFVELHTERGLTLAPGSYDLSEVGASYDSCEICVIGVRNINPQTGTDSGYMIADSGTVEIVEASTEEGESFLVRLGDDVEMRNVRLVNSGGRITTEDIPGDARWCTQGLEVSGVGPRTE